MSRAPALPFLLLLAGGCPAWLAPPPLPGAQEGAACTADVDCDSGLVCACGTCATPDGEDLPPSCEVTLDDACREPPSPCFAACGDPTTLGPAECVNGRESCGELGGVLESQCDPDICWGAPAVGEICDDGEFVCELGRSATTGLCYTNDCAGEPGLCIANDESCATGAPYAEACLAGAYQCEAGFPIEDCGGCLGPPPDCIASCVDPTVVAEAFCDTGLDDYSCDHIQDAVRADSCGCEAGDLLLDSQAAIDAFADATCLIGTLTIQTTGVVEVHLPLLESVSGTFAFSSSTAEVARLPALASVGGFAVQGNALLETLEVPALTATGDVFVITDNPRLPTCRADAILAQLEAVPPFVQIQNNLTGPGLCDEPDAGPGDGGVGDGGLVDAGDGDAGSGDAGRGPVDAGDGDAGDGDAGDGDAGSGPVDAGDGDAGSGAVDAGDADAGPP